MGLVVEHVQRGARHLPAVDAALASSSTSRGRDVGSGRGRRLALAKRLGVSMPTLGLGPVLGRCRVRSRRAPVWARRRGGLSTPGTVADSARWRRRVVGEDVASLTRWRGRYELADAAEAEDAERLARRPRRRRKLRASSTSPGGQRPWAADVAASASMSVMVCRSRPRSRCWPGARWPRTIPRSVAAPTSTLLRPRYGVPPDHPQAVRADDEVAVRWVAGQRMRIPVERPMRCRQLVVSQLWSLRVDVEGLV